MTQIESAKVERRGGWHGPGQVPRRRRIYRRKLDLTRDEMLELMRATDRPVTRLPVGHAFGYQPINFKGFF